MDEFPQEPDRWTIGDTTLTAIVEAETPGIPVELFFPEATASDVIDAGPLPEGAVGSDGTISFRVQSFVIQHRGRLIVVDPCVGNHKSRLLPFWDHQDWPWMSRFTDAGFDPDQVDLVVHTHLHEDHIGWDTHLVDGSWLPTFTNARHVYVGDELDWAASEDRRSQQDSFGDSIAPVLDAGLGWEVDSGAVLGDGLFLMPTPGHTPGHASLVVETSTEPLIVTGDLLHHPFQFATPALAEIGDVDPARARNTRCGFFDEYSRSGTLIAGTHFPAVPLGRIEAASGAWRFRPENPSPRSERPDR